MPDDKLTDALAYIFIGMMIAVILTGCGGSAEPNVTSDQRSSYATVAVSN